MLTLPFRSARQLASDLRRRKIGALELLELYLARVERYNPRLNAIIATDLDAARKRARAADRALARGEVWGPLHGVQMTMKEWFDVVGMPTTWGLPELKDNYPPRNALAVDRFLAAGVVLFGKTDVPLYLADWQSYNAIYGTTNNPWDLARVPGGSSGGSAAALAAGLTGLEAGSDIGASIRNPAHYCGVFGHKPTYGIAPPRGQALPGRGAGGGNPGGGAPGPGGARPGAPPRGGGRGRASPCPRPAGRRCASTGSPSCSPTRAPRWTARCRTGSRRSPTSSGGSGRGGATTRGPRWTPPRRTACTCTSSAPPRPGGRRRRSSRRTSRPRAGSRPPTRATSPGWRARTRCPTATGSPGTRPGN